MYDLQCRFDSRRSFYGKAKVKETNRCKELYSYNTLTARITWRTAGKVIYKYYGYFSQTTTRHQKEFFKQEGLTDKEIKELFKNGKLEKYL